MRIPLVDLAAQHKELESDITAAIERVIASCAFSGGPEVEAFEQAFAEYCQVPHCVGVSSGTAALELMLRAYGIGPGDEVITVPNTFFATPESISLVGATPVFVDVYEHTACMNPTLLEAAITSRTRAIIPVHLFGQTADMDSILSIAKAHGLWVFEDSCQAHGAVYRGKRAGSLANGAAFSFYPGKNLGAYGEAGAVTLADTDKASTIRLLREHGSPRKYEHTMVGRNDRMDGLQAAVLSVKLQHLNEWNERRRRLVHIYQALLSTLPEVQYFSEHEGGTGAYHLFVVRVPNRDTVLQKLHAQGVMAGIHYPLPMHMQPAYAHLHIQEGTFPVAEQLSREILSLPLYPHMTEEQVHMVVDALKNSL